MSIKEVIREIKDSYVGVSTFIKKGWIILAIPICAGTLQHGYQFTQGLFASSTRPEGLTLNFLVALIVIKHIAILFTLVVIPRYFLHNNNLLKSVRFGKTSKQSMVKIVSFVILMGLLTVYGGRALVFYGQQYGLNFPKSIIGILPVLFFFVYSKLTQFSVFNLFANIFGDQPLATDKAKIADSYMSKQSAVYFIIVAPILAIYYYLHMLAFKAQGVELVVILGADSLLMGLLSAVLGVAVWLSYQNAKSYALGAPSKKCLPRNLIFKYSK